MMWTSTARNWVGVSRSTALVGSPTSRCSSRRSAASGFRRGSARTSSTRPRSPPVNSASTVPACGSSTRTAVSTACETTASVWLLRRRAWRCWDVPPAAVRPWTCRASTLETTRSGPSKTPTAQRPRRTSRTAARRGRRAVAAKPVSSAGSGSHANGARRVSVVVSAQVTCTAPSAVETSAKAPCRSATPSSQRPRRSGGTPSRRPPPAAGRARLTGRAWQAAGAGGRGRSGGAGGRDLQRRDLQLGLVGVQRRGIQIALGEVAALCPKALVLDLGLDALGHELEAQGARQLDEATHDRRHLLVLGDHGDEGAVDLEDVHRELPQVAQRGVAGPEVVDRQPQAEVAQALQVLGR